MKFERLSNLFVLLFACFLLVVSGCDDDRPIDIPDDSDPVITLLKPSTGHSLQFRGESLDINFRMDDQEQLNAFWVTETWTSVNGQVYIKNNDTYISEKVISGNNRIEQLTYTVPAQGSGIQDYSSITLTGHVRDNKGKEDQVSVRINVLPEPGTEPPYQVSPGPTAPNGPTYNDTIYSILTGSRFNYSFLNVTNTPSNPSEYDIRENSPSSVGFQGILTTPNQGSADSTLAIVSQADFNFDSLTWKTTWEAFVTSNRLNNETDPVQVGDIVIVSMITKPHFAIMRIKEKLSNAIVFEYKYTYQ